MNNLNITVELCAEDRARLDKITALLERTIEQNTPTTVVFDDPLRKKLEQAVASVKPDVVEPAGTPQDATEAPTPTDTPVEPETPTEPAPAPQEEPEVTPDDLLAKARALIYTDTDGSKGIKAKVKDICLAYAPQITQIPADKCGEVMAKLNALEG